MTNLIQLVWLSVWDDISFKFNIIISGNCLSIISNLNRIYHLIKI